MGKVSALSITGIRSRNTAGQSRITGRGKKCFPLARQVLRSTGKRELAVLYAEQGRMADLKRLAAEMVPIFSSLHIHREALAALAYFRQAVETERASLALVNGVAAYLRRAEHNPSLRFQEPEE